MCAQKAYANWSNGKLYSLRFATLEEGVQPIQTYGFRDGENQDKSKNLADFHLFDEALRLLDTQPHITTFVIASGDGDFIPLITHLKEHGKRVIVCANAGSENPKLVEFCDHLVLIRLAEVIEERDLPDRGEVRRREPQKPYIIKPKRASWPTVNTQIVKRIGAPPAATSEAAIAWIRRLLQEYAANTQATDLLKRIGQPISGFKVFLKEHIPQLDGYIKQVPTRKLKRYLELVLADTPFTMMNLEGSVVLALQDHPPAKAKLLDVRPSFNSQAHSRLTHPINERILPELESMSVTTDAEVNTAVIAVVNAYANDAEIRLALATKGIGLSCLKEMVNHLIPGFERWQKQVFGFSKFGHYLRYVCRDTEFCIATDKGLNSVLLLRNHVPEGCVVLSDRDREAVPSVAVYAEFLKLDVPRLMLPQERTLPETTQYVLTHAQEPQTFADLEVLISRESGLKVQEVRAGLNTLVRVGVLEAQGKGEMASRSLQLIPVYRDVDTVLRVVEAELRQRLAAHFDTVDANTLRQLIYPQVMSL
ncbi:MAG: NYN domain-containing protein [Synechococcaceae cyanobacterium SM2_3_60]|nr:NYN domain-containing protein [Synechococcaceae cyanobacterium SM2_3_60]